MIRKVLGGLAGLVAALVISAGSAQAQAPVLSPAVVTGSAAPFTVTLSWSPTAGATGYRVDYGLTPGTTAGSLPLGAVTSVPIPGVPVGVYYVRVVALPGGATSNEITVTAVPTPPQAPTNLQVSRLGTTVVAVWDPPAGGSAPTSYQLRAGYTPTGNDFIVPVAGTTFATPAPPATYYLRVVALNAAGPSVESNTVAVTMTPAGACDAPPAVTINTSTFITYLTVSWTQVPGVQGYLLDAFLNGNQVYSNIPFGPGSIVSQVVPIATYDVRVRAVWGAPCAGTQGTQASKTFVVDGAPPPGPRTPDPAPGQYLAVPGYLRDVVTQTANDRPDLLRNSCVDTGGNNRFMFEVTRRLRAIDNRWGNNIKRCSQGLSQDIVDYNRSSQPDQGARTNALTTERNINLFDIIGGHCGGNPGPNWTDVTQATLNGNACAEWTLLPYIQAGFPP